MKVCERMRCAWGARVALVLAVALSCYIRTTSGAEVGDACTNRRAKLPGECRLLSNCPYAQKLTKEGTAPQLCGFKRGSRSPTVCCPVVPELLQAEDPGDEDRGPCQHLLIAQNKPPSTSGSVSSRMCEKYAVHACSWEKSSFGIPEAVLDHCQSQNKTDTLIVGGRLAKEKEYPHMALLGYGKQRKDIQYLCGGSLISPNFVLTAAHCLHSNDDVPVSWALLGALKRTEEQHPFSRPQLIAVTELIQHPDFTPGVKYHDIALLRLGQDVEFVQGYVRPACISQQPLVERKQHSAVVTGWGNTGWDEDKSDFLQTVEVNFTSLSFCNEHFKKTAKLEKGIIDSQLCAGNVGKDSCEGDSGGPLQLKPSKPYCMFHIVGVVSFGRFCAFGAPGVYTRVASYVPWIEGIVWPNGQ